MRMEVGIATTTTLTMKHGVSSAKKGVYLTVSSKCICRGVSVSVVLYVVRSGVHLNAAFRWICAGARSTH